MKRVRYERRWLSPLFLLGINDKDAFRQEILIDSSTALGMTLLRQKGYGGQAGKRRTKNIEHRIQITE
jgi:hypothetical protein